MLQAQGSLRSCSAGKGFQVIRLCGDVPSRSGRKPEVRSLGQGRQWGNRYKPCRPEHCGPAPHRMQKCSDPYRTKKQTACSQCFGPCKAKGGAKARPRCLSSRWQQSHGAHAGRFCLSPAQSHLAWPPVPFLYVVGTWVVVPPATPFTSDPLLPPVHGASPPQPEAVHLRV